MLNEAGSLRSQCEIGKRQDLTPFISDPIHFELEDGLGLQDLTCVPDEISQV